MSKRLIVVLIFYVCSLIFFPGFREHTSESTNMVFSNDNISQNDIYAVEESKLIAEIPDSKIKLYFIKNDNGMYKGFILQIDDLKRFFKWENVTNPTFRPEMKLADLDGDGQSEIIVQLCRGYGTGIYDEEVHVIKQKHAEEILVENPAIILYKNVIAKEYPEYFKIIVGNKTSIINKKGILTPPYDKVGVGWGVNNTRYEVKNNALYARVRVGAGVTSIGVLIIKYKYQNNILQKESINFSKYEN